MNPMRQQRGFNLVELMIGLTISLMGLAAVASMMMTFSKNRGSVAQTQAAQDNGVMALYRLERDISQAGYGLMDLQGCTPTIVNGDGTNPSFSPLPISIGFVGTGVSDTILVQGTNPVSGIPGTELSSPTAGGNTMTAGQFNVRSCSYRCVGTRLHIGYCDQRCCYRDRLHPGTKRNHDNWFPRQFWDRRHCGQFL